tara:strand:+ start:156 stop:1037 length:882 start_codon:yes stop_codon:yes gene_type:complete
MIKLFKKDHTDQNLTTWQWICANSDQIEKQNKILQQTDLQKIPLLLEFNHSFNLKSISKDIEIAKQKYGDWGWLSENNPDGKNKPYSGFGLTWNPDHNLKLPEHQSVLGSPDRSKFTYDVSKSGPDGERFGDGKNDYVDTLGLNVRTRASKFGAIGELLNNVKRTLVKSRISTIHGNKPEMGLSRPFHRDANVFTGTRVNIPIDTDKPYVFDMQTLQEPAHLEVGKAYSFDTSTLHRVISMRPCSNPRTHIVINVSPWWDWNQDEECWQTNEFYGKMHPLEMIYEGHIMDGLC